jgi:hypothetical protein
MPYQHTASIWITRTAVDDHGDEIDIDVEIDVHGTWRRAEPDVGIMRPYFEDVWAEDETGKVIELTERQIDRAIDALRETA